ncbi:TonB-dependent receptor [Novosphingobium aquimarinum]|uniref:TonB-dependent receptor n=1 Tax=Novosphingobium aquimarinum TaxID=2682494 RepID=UPI0012EB5BB0|nr:TonB-dependent receptor [Novosphingobium aquimarinum]
MRNSWIKACCLFGVSAAAFATAGNARADDEPIGDIVVTGQATTYNNSALDETLIDDKSAVSSVIDLIGTLPGVQVNQGDAYGFDDWSTTLSVRGYQTNLDQQQVGSTIDGLPNGGSGYGGGSKANRYVDTMNIDTVEVFQGTADIASRSNEALGGTINFVTANPLDISRVRVSASGGSFGAKRIYGRVDTGTFAAGAAKAWFSYSYQQASDWIEHSAQNHRDHAAAKITADLLPVRLTAYASYDNTQEDNYDQIYSAAQFAAFPDTDGLVGVWTGIPYQDQAYRRAWSTLRENFFSYLKADAELADMLKLEGSVYYHEMGGRGDWVPQYVVDVTADGVGNPQSELDGSSTVNGGSPLGTIYFVDAAGRALTPIAGCLGNIPYPYGGTTDPNYDPACYEAGAIGAQSYRHTHYRKKRLGFTGDGALALNFGDVANTLRAGFWYEDTTRREYRNWHNVIDTKIGPKYEEIPYWTQYSRKYPQDTFKWYAQDEVTFGPVTANFGVKQFLTHIDREDLFGETPNDSIRSKSDLLLSGGVQVNPIAGLNFFAGYSENFKALTDALLEFSNADFSEIKPETAENWEAGVRYSSGILNASATWFKSKFSNQVIFVSNSTGAGNDYLGEGDGKFFNAGGIDSEGLEILANVRPLPGLSLYGSYTYIDATYRGTGNPTLDTEQGITPGNRVAGIPEHMWVLSGTYQAGPLTFGVTGKYTGDRFVNTANTWIAENFFLTDISVALRSEDIDDSIQGLELRLNITNVTDESYLGGIAANYAWIGAPRTAIVTLTADF